MSALVARGLALSAVAGTLLFLTGCDDTLFGVGAEGPDGGDPPAETGYAGVVAIAADHCMPCHSAATATFGLDLETDVHAATVGVTSTYGGILVAEGSPEDSIFYTKMTGEQQDNQGTDMPPGGRLGAAFTDIVRDWILDGAPAE